MSNDHSGFLLNAAEAIVTDSNAIIEGMPLLSSVPVQATNANAGGATSWFSMASFANRPANAGFSGALKIEFALDVSNTNGALDVSLVVGTKRVFTRNVGIGDDELIRVTYYATWESATVFRQWLEVWTTTTGSPRTFVATAASPNQGTVINTDLEDETLNFSVEAQNVASGDTVDLRFFTLSPLTRLT